MAPKQKDLTPTPAQVRRMPKQDEFVIQDADGGSETFKPGDCVFVVHGEMEIGGERENGHDYWKLQIHSIHKGSGHVWVLGNWFYSPEELEKLPNLSASSKGLIPSMGNTEMVATDHVGVVDAQCLEYHLYMHVFNDKAQATARDITPRSWFTRTKLTFSGAEPKIMSMNRHCKCDKPYSPVEDRQRFCSGCKAWFDESCMQRVGVPKLLKGTPAARLNSIPIMRGWGGTQEPKAWMTAGTGRLVDVIREAEVKEGNIAEQWEGWGELLTPEFVQFVKTTKFVQFLCPGCQQHI